MATKTKSKKDPAKKDAKPKRTIPKAGGDYKGVEVAEVEVLIKTMSVRERRVTLSLEAKLEELELTEAYDVLVDSRLNVLLEIDAHQQELFDNVLPRLENVADCKRISAGVSTVTWTLAFDGQTIDTEAVRPFVGKQATFWAAKVGRPVKGDGDADETEGSEDPAEVAAGKDK